MNYARQDANKLTILLKIIYLSTVNLQIFNSLYVIIRFPFSSKIVFWNILPVCAMITMDVIFTKTIR